MNEELQSKMVEIMSGLQETIGQAKDFTLEQMPDVVLSYVAFGRAWSIVEVVFFLVLVSSAIWLCWWLFKDVQKGYDKRTSGDFLEVAITIYGFFVGVGGAFGFVLSLKNSLLVWFAPKVWLLMELADIVRGKCG